MKIDSHSNVPSSSKTWETCLFYRESCPRVAMASPAINRERAGIVVTSDLGTIKARGHFLRFSKNGYRGTEGAMLPVRTL